MGLLSLNTSRGSQSILLRASLGNTNPNAIEQINKYPVKRLKGERQKFRRSMRRLAVHFMQSGMPVRENNPARNLCILLVDVLRSAKRLPKWLRNLRTSQNVLALTINCYDKSPSGISPMGNMPKHVQPIRNLKIRLRACN